MRPNSPNTIPGRTVFSIDSRHPTDAVLAKLANEMRSACERIAGESDLDLEFDETSESSRVEFDKDCIATIRDTAKRLGVPHMDIYSGAGHDACNLARIVPTGMIFVPCERGISHNEKENARPDDLAAGCEVLLHVMLDRAGRVSA